MLSPDAVATMRLLLTIGQITNESVTLGWNALYIYIHKSEYNSSDLSLVIKEIAVMYVLQFPGYNTSRAKMNQKSLEDIAHHFITLSRL